MSYVINPQCNVIPFLGPETFFVFKYKIFGLLNSCLYIIYVIYFTCILTGFCMKGAIKKEKKLTFVAFMIEW